MLYMVLNGKHIKTTESAIMKISDKYTYGEVYETVLYSKYNDIFKASGGLE